MKIRKLLIAAITLLMFTAVSNKAEAQITWDNNTPCYYLGVFISDPCPIPQDFRCPERGGDYYYDVPDNYTYTHGGPGLIDQKGINQAHSKINGLCLLDISTGRTYFVDFCMYGTSGSVTFPAPTGCGGGSLTVNWDILSATPFVRLW